MAEQLQLSKDGVLAAARLLSVPERIDLYTALRDELGKDLGDPLVTEADGEFSAEQLAELDRRMARHEADPTAAVPWEQIESDLDESYGTNS